MLEQDKIKDIKPIDGTPLVEVIYGDSVIGDSIIELKGDNKTIANMFDNGYDKTVIWEKEYVKSNYRVKSPKGNYNNIKYIMRHKTEKQLFKIITNDSYVIVTKDHSLMACKKDKYNNYQDLFEQMETYKPEELSNGDYMLSVNNICTIIDVINLGITNEYVYDICVDTDNEEEHVFYANNILVHNTDSLYLCYENLLKTIKGADKWSDRQKTEFLVKFNQEFLDKHNKEFMNKYYEDRHVHSIHDFELETIAKSGVWINVKKRYAQILTWKDGRFYDDDELPMKVKGLEIVKSSYPEISRNILKKMTRSLLETKSNDEYTILCELNILMQQAKKEWLEADLESICPTISVNGYTKYIISDDKPEGFEFRSGCPFAVKGLALYNNLRQVNKLPGDPIYGGKMKYYVVSVLSAKKQKSEQVFCFMPSEYPEWAPKYAPINRRAMFEKCVLDPFNRILEGINFKTLNWDGYIDAGFKDTLF